MVLIKYLLTRLTTYWKTEKMLKFNKDYDFCEVLWTLTVQINWKIKSYLHYKFPFKIFFPLRYAFLHIYGETAITLIHITTPQATLHLSISDLRETKDDFHESRGILYNASATKWNLILSVIWWEHTKYDVTSHACSKAPHVTPCNEVGSCCRVKCRVSDFQLFHVQILIAPAGRAW